MPFAHVCGGIAGIAEQFRQCRGWRQILAAVREMLADVKAEGIPAGEHRCACGRANGGGAVPLRAADALAGDTVEVRRLDAAVAITRRVPVAHIVGKHQDDVGPRRSLRAIRLPCRQSPNCRSATPEKAAACHRRTLDPRPLPCCHSMLPFQAHRRMAEHTCATSSSPNSGKQGSDTTSRTACRDTVRSTLRHGQPLSAGCSVSSTG